MKIQTIDALRIMARVTARVLVFRNQLLPAARVSSQRRAAEGEIRRRHTVLHKRVYARNKPACMAAGVGHALRLRDGCAAGRGQLAIAMLIRKKFGYDVELKLNEVNATVIDGKTHVHLDVDAELEKDELMKILKNIGL